MIECQYKTFNGKLVFKIQAERPDQLFAQIAEIQSVFEADTSCGCCNSTEIKYIVRKSADKKGQVNTYHEWACQNPGCRAKLAFGEYREPKGGLFAKTWNAESKRYYPYRGWKIWRKGQAEQSDADDREPWG